MAILFRSHTDLLQEFTYFLPDSSNNPVNYVRHPAGGLLLFEVIYLGLHAVQFQTCHEPSRVQALKVQALKMPSAADKPATANDC